MNFQLQNNPAGCAAFVDALGLKILFALLMKGAKRKSKHTDKDFDGAFLFLLSSHTFPLSTHIMHVSDLKSMLCQLYCRCFEAWKAIGAQDS